MKTNCAFLGAQNNQVCTQYDKYNNNLHIPTCIIIIIIIIGRLRSRRSQIFSNHFGFEPSQLQPLGVTCCLYLPIVFGYRTGMMFSVGLASFSHVKECREFPHNSILNVFQTNRMRICHLLHSPQTCYSNFLYVG